MWPREDGGYFVKDNWQPWVHVERLFEERQYRILLLLPNGLPEWYKKEGIKMKIDKKKRTVSLVGESQEEDTRYKDVWLRFQNDFPIPEDCDMEKISYDDAGKFIRIQMPIIPNKTQRPNTHDDDDDDDESQRIASMPQEPDHGNEYNTPKMTTNDQGGIVEEPDHKNEFTTPMMMTNDVQGGVLERRQKKKPLLIGTTLLIAAFISLLVAHTYDHIVWMIYKKLG
ncbi:unnamed protein product [Cuscuta epithymum]|nr:unnamed protein product [Cuscuta epithymum]